MTGIMFNYSVRVRRIFWIGEGKDMHTELEGNWVSFSTILQAVLFAKTNPCRSIERLPCDYVIEITLNGVVLEQLCPADWKRLAGVEENVELLKDAK